MAARSLARSLPPSLSPRSPRSPGGPTMLRRGATVAARASLRLSTLRRAPHAPLSTAGGSKVSFVFVEDGEEVPVTAEEGKTLLEVAHDNEVELEGACDGSLACSTCHLILEQNVFDSLPAPEEEELDMLDLAFGLTDTSRLGCQIKVTKGLEGAKFTVPDGSNNMQP
mmetsp:Transcript_7082/g.19969  ORF Transcript_7082/g.19969 Transcript_7082/m.19969 type:complete len:168 (-) Transcript_7082:190-693(-)